MPIKTFREIIAWKKANEFVLMVYKLTQNFPKAEVFGLTNQLRRCSVSVASNIVEGFKRGSKKDSQHFYTIAESSLEEAKYQLMLANQLGYIGFSKYQEIEKLGEETGKLLYGWKKSQK